MGTRIGLIAGSGEVPIAVLKEANRRGYSCVVAAIRGEAEGRLKKEAEHFSWIGAGQLSRLISFFRSHGIQDVYMAGKVEFQTLYRTEALDALSVHLLSRLKSRNPESILKGLTEYLSTQGIEVKDPGSFYEPYLCEEGILTQAGPSTKLMEDIQFGWNVARNVSNWDIGQTVIVKDRAVVAVEGLEGTDEAIQRSGKLSGKGAVVVKVSRSHQDTRFDMPAVGISTIRSLVKAGAAALCIEAHKVLFFQREESLSLANKHHILILSKKDGTSQPMERT